MAYFNKIVAHTNKIEGGIHRVTKTNCRTLIG